MVQPYVIALSGVLLFGSGVAPAQQCLHANNETPDQQQRRMDAINAMRTLNTAEVMNLSIAKRFVSFAELVASAAWGNLNRSGKLSGVPNTDLLPGFDLRLTTDGTSYSISLKDRIDPCGFTVYTNDVGIIFTGYPIDYSVTPSQ